MFILLGVICLFILVLSSTWISAAEIGITSLSKYRVKKLIAQTPKLSRSLISWLKSPYYLLVVMLTINVISDMLTSFLSTFIMTQAFYMINRHIVEFVTWILTSSFLVVFCEIVPKIYARAHAEKITIFSVPILSKIEKISKPFLYPIIKLTELLTPKTIDISSSGLSKEEVSNIITEGDTSGVLDKETSSMLKRTLSFGDLSAKRIMIPFSDIESVDIGLDDELFLDHAVETSRSRVPVYINNRANIIGYVHIKDILWAWQENKGHFIRSRIKPAYFVSQTKKINELLKEFQSGKTHIAFVKDDDENIIGMVTLEDILEEVVGEILDEYELKQ